ncbi:hypothetical protein ACFPRL_01295 [Pseudoclavibacter helvolus]
MLLRHMKKIMTPRRTRGRRSVRSIVGAFLAVRTTTMHARNDGKRI